MAVDENATPCRTGAGDLFVQATWGGGDVGPGDLPLLYSVDRDGDLFEFRGKHVLDGHSVAEGTGKIHAAPGTLHNVTKEAVRRHLEIMDQFEPDRDYNVTLALVANVSRDSFRDFCIRTLDDHYDLKPYYDDPGCQDGSVFNMTVSTSSGIHTAAAYCQGGSSSFDRVRSSFMDLVTEVETRLGVAS